MLEGVPEFWLALYFRAGLNKTYLYSHNHNHEIMLEENAVQSLWNACDFSITSEWYRWYSPSAWTGEKHELLTSSHYRGCAHISTTDCISLSSACLHFTDVHKLFSYSLCGLMGTFSTHTDEVAIIKRIICHLFNSKDILYFHQGRAYCGTRRF